MFHKDAIYGLLYVDIIGRPSFFRQEHLGLLSAMANLVAVKIKNLQFEVETLQRREFTDDDGFLQPPETGDDPSEANGAPDGIAHDRDSRAIRASAGTDRCRAP